jgi:hypothetical protein
MNKFDEHSDFLSNAVILLQKITYYNIPCLEMAAEADCKQFIALPSVQNLTNDIWNGKIYLGGANTGFKVIYFFRIYFRKNFKILNSNFFLQKIVSNILPFARMLSSIFFRRA